MKYRVIGSRRVNGVEPGGTVDLDPAVTRVEMLLGRHIEEIPRAKAKPPVEEVE